MQSTVLDRPSSIQKENEKTPSWDYQRGIPLMQEEPSLTSITQKSQDVSQTEPIVIIRPSFKKICGDNDACRAAVFNQLLYSIAWKVKQGCQYWFAAAEDICAAIDNSWCLKKVRQEVAKLVRAGLLGQRHNPGQKWDRTFQYFFGEEQGQKLKALAAKIGICLQHIGLPKEVLNLLKKVHAVDDKCICQKDQMHLVNMPNASSRNAESNCPKGEIEPPDTPNRSGKNGGAIPKEPTKEPFIETKTEEQAKEPVQSHQQRNTEPLPSLPPPSVDFSFESITSEIPHDWEAIHAIATHYLGRGKVTQTDAEALIKKTQTLASLAGAQEVRRQFVMNLTFMLYSDAASNWYKGEKRKQITLRTAATYFEDYARKANEVQWTPPSDKVPTWFNETSEAAGPTAEDPFAGMTQLELDHLADQVQALYPGMKMSDGGLPDNRFTLGLWINETAWLDLYSARDWHEREQFHQWPLVLEAYQQYARREVA